MSSYSTLSFAHTLCIAATRDTMDVDEAFEQMQLERVIAEEPDSVAFVKARKAVLKRGGGAGARRLRG